MTSPDVAAPGRGLFPDDLLRTCISCGFCLSACPTYQDTRNEASSPRGRINLMRALEAGTLGEDDVREELSFCLGCRACEPVCPAGVRYGTLLEHGRDAVGPARDPKLRGLLMAVGTPRRTRLVGRMMRTGQLLGLHRIAPSRALRAAGRAAPMVASPAAWRVRRTVGPEQGEPAALFLGCVGHLMFSSAAHAACGTLATAGYRVTTPPEQGCCGALHAHNGELDGARRLADWTVRAFAGSDGPIVTTAGGCGAFMADYGTLLGTPEAAAFGARVRDYSTLFGGARPAGAPRRTAARRLPGLVPPAERPEGDARATRAARVAARRRGRRSPQRGPLLRCRRHLRADAPGRLAALPGRQDGRDRGGGRRRDRERQSGLPPAVPPGRAARAAARTCACCTRPSSWQSACSGSQLTAGTLAE